MSRKLWGLKEGGGSSKKGTFLEKIRSECFTPWFQEEYISPDLNFTFNQAL